jgi:hypothetical protein
MSVTIDGSASVTINSGAILGITSGTAVASTSGTSIDFTGIPSWVKRITVMFSAVSTSGTSIPQIQIGSGSALTSGYAGQTWTGNTNNSAHSTGFLIAGVWGATYAAYGHAVLTNISGNIWVFSTANAATSSGSSSVGGGGNTTLSGTLDRVRITTVNGTDTFDAGSVNILYE